MNQSHHSGMEVNIHHVLVAVRRSGRAARRKVGNGEKEVEVEGLEDLVLSMVMTERD